MDSGKGEMRGLAGLWRRYIEITGSNDIMGQSVKEIVCTNGSSEYRARMPRR